MDISVNFDLENINKVLELGFKLINLSDEQINEFYTNFKSQFDNFDPNNNGTNSVMKRFKVYEFYATQGVHFTNILQEIFDESVGENGNTYISSEAPEIALWILRIFDDTILSNCEIRLQNEGLDIHLPRGWVWYWESLAYLIMGLGEQMVHCMKISDKEDLEHSQSHGLAFQRLQEFKMQIVHKIQNAEPNFVNTLVETTLIEDFEENFENKFLDLVGMSYGLVTYSNFDPKDNYRLEKNFRFYFTLLETIYRNIINSHFLICNIHPQNIRDQFSNFTSLGTLQSLNGLRTAFYNDHSDFNNSWNSDSNAEIQLQILNSQIDELTDFNPYKLILIIKNARNLFLHNFEFSLQSSLERILTGEDKTKEAWIRSVLRISWEFLFYLYRELKESC